MARGAVASPLADLRRALRLLRWPNDHLAISFYGLVYRGPHDFVLQHGEPFKPRALPPGVRRGLPKLCYANAIHAAILYDLDYVEGYATCSPSGDMPIHHAWNATADGQVVDTTWRAELGPGGPVVGTPATAYLGVRFTVERADDATWNGDATILDDHQRNWPLLRERWTGERPDLQYPPSPRLDSVRALRAGDRSALEDAVRRMRAEGSCDVPPGTPLAPFPRA